MLVFYRYSTDLFLYHFTLRSRGHRVGVGILNNKKFLLITAVIAVIINTKQIDNYIKLDSNSLVFCDYISYYHFLNKACSSILVKNSSGKCLRLIQVTTSFNSLVRYNG